VEEEETASERLIAVDNSIIYDHIVVQSETERKFVEKLNAANGGRARDLATTHRQTRRAAAKHSSPAENYTARASGDATNSKMW
jgi:hypothetical protein